MNNLNLGNVGQMICFFNLGFLLKGFNCKRIAFLVIIGLTMKFAIVH